MNLNPMNWLTKAAPSTGVLNNHAPPQGEWTETFDNWVAREVNPNLYESLREAVPVIDAAINRLTTLDGVMQIEVERDAMRAELEDWMETVQVGDMQQGFQAFYAGCSNELYEQGHALGEFIYSAGRKDVVRLNVADSKGTLFKRKDGKLEVWYRNPRKLFKSANGSSSDNIDAVLNNRYQASVTSSTLIERGYRKLDRARMIYAVHHPEGDSPYGTSLIRSLEFVSKILLTIDNSLLLVWQRFGDPSFNMTYKSSRNLTDAQLKARQNDLHTNLSRALAIKKKGGSADFVNALSKGDDLILSIIGESGQMMDVETPAKHVMEQIVAKTGLAPWILGYVWGTAERLADMQSKLMLQESRTRFAMRKSGLVKPIEAMLRARGKTWSRGDWNLVQSLPNMQDMMATAQAKFLEAQTELMLGNANSTPPTEINSQKQRRRQAKAAAPAPRTKAEGEAVAEQSASMAERDQQTIDALQSRWQADYSKMMKLIGLGGVAKAEGDLFVYNNQWLPELKALESALISELGAEGGALAAPLHEAWIEGATGAAAELSREAIMGAVSEAAVVAMNAAALDHVKDVVVRSLSDDILPVMASGIYDGLNPTVVARQLKGRFDAHDYDWQRMVQSEMTAASATGKLDQYAAQEVGEYEYINAGDGDVSTICIDLANASPYTVGEGPLPVRDSHPGCRCSVRAVAP